MLQWQGPGATADPAATYADVLDVLTSPAPGSAASRTAVVRVDRRQLLHAQPRGPITIEGETTLTREALATLRRSGSWRLDYSRPTSSRR
jgi:hypothetical protein